MADVVAAPGEDDDEPNGRRKNGEDLCTRLTAKLEEQRGLLARLKDLADGIEARARSLEEGRGGR